MVAISDMSVGQKFNVEVTDGKMPQVVKFSFTVLETGPELYSNPTAPDQPLTDGARVEILTVEGDSPIRAGDVYIYSQAQLDWLNPIPA